MQAGTVCPSNSRQGTAVTTIVFNEDATPEQMGRECLTVSGGRFARSARLPSRPTGSNIIALQQLPLFRVDYRDESRSTSYGDVVSTEEQRP